MQKKLDQNDSNVRLSDEQLQKLAAMVAEKFASDIYRNIGRGIVKTFLTFLIVSIFVFLAIQNGWTPPRK